jgi:hypothetical protein
MQENLESTVGRVVNLGLVAATLFITPWWALDPINPIKMLVVVPVGFMCLALLAANRSSVEWNKYKLVLGLTASFVAWQILVLFVSDGAFNQQIFGSQGRNTGLITYFAFSLIFIGAVIASNSIAMKRLVLVALAVGTASIAYGFIQAIGADPINWVNPYSPVFGFLGNPNFQSSLLGILGSILFAQQFVKGMKSSLRVLLIAYLLATLYIIKETVSQQGFLVLAIGLGVVTGLYLLQRKRSLGITYGLLSFFTFFLVLF